MIGRTVATVILVAACAGAPPSADPTQIPAPPVAGTLLPATVAPLSPTPSAQATSAEAPATATATATALHTPSPAPTEQATPTPGMAAIVPTAVIPADAGGSINMVGFGSDVWATVEGGLLRINARTGEATTVTHPAPVSHARYLAASSDWIWLSDFYNRTVHRIDPATGEITGTLRVPGDPRTVLIGDDEVWAPTNGGSTYRIDPETMEIVDEPIPHQASAYGLGSLWVGDDEAGSVLRIDPDTAAVLAEIAIPADGSACRVGGRFPAGVWGWCGLASNRTVVTRLDPDTGQAIGSVDLGGATSSSSGVLVMDGGAWFPLIAPGPGQSGRLVRVNLETNEIDRAFDGGPSFDVNEAVVAGDSLWASMEGSQEIWRFPLEQLEPSR